MFKCLQSTPNRPVMNGSFPGTSIATTQLPQQPALMFVGAVVGTG
jgi:hypothetical protein